MFDARNTGTSPLRTNGDKRTTGVAIGHESKQKKIDAEGQLYQRQYIWQMDGRTLVLGQKTTLEGDKHILLMVDVEQGSRVPWVSGRNAE